MARYIDGCFLADVTNPEREQESRQGYFPFLPDGGLELVSLLFGEQGEAEKILCPEPKNIRRFHHEPFLNEEIDHLRAESFDVERLLAHKVVEPLAASRWANRVAAIVGDLLART